MAEIPSQIEDAAQAVALAGWCLRLVQDWDGEGSPGYHSDTLARAWSLVVCSTCHLSRFRHVAVPPPEVDNGPDGSFDVTWTAGDGEELLVNVPAEPTEACEYYGRKWSGPGLTNKEIRGAVAPHELCVEPLLWLLSPRGEEAGGGAGS